MEDGTTAGRVATRPGEQTTWGHGLDVPLRDGYPSFSPEEIGRRHESVRRLLAAQNVDVLLLYGAGRFNSDLQFLTNWPGGREGYLVLPRDGEPELLVQLFNHVPMAQRLSLVPRTEWAGADSVQSVARAIRAAVGSGGSARVGLSGSLPFSQYQRLAAALEPAQIVDLNRAYRDLRLIRSEEELRFFRAAAELTDRAIERIARDLRPGIHEYDIATSVETACLEAGGYSGIHFIASTPMQGGETAVFVPHQYQSNRVLREGDAVITEISGGFWGYTGQAHRTFFLGEPTEEWAALHRASQEAYEAIEAVLRDGATLDQLLDAAEIIDRSGYTIYDDLLHGANQYPPIVKTRSTSHSNPASFVFRSGMVVTLQPQLTTPDRRIGMQYGETVLITPTGVERLHRFPRQMVVVGG